MTSMEMTRMVGSGTEAVMSAIRLARGYTGKDYIVKFKGCYHGHSDGLLVKSGSGALTQAVPDSALTSDTEEYAKYFRYMLENGINLAPSQFEAMFISAAHTKEDLEKIAEIIRKYKAV